MRRYPKTTELQHTAPDPRYKLLLKLLLKLPPKLTEIRQLFYAREAIVYS